MWDRLTAAMLLGEIKNLNACSVNCREILEEFVPDQARNVNRLKIFGGCNFRKAKLKLSPSW